MKRAIELKNAKDIVSGLRKMSKAMAAQIIRQGTRTGATVILRGVKRITPVRTGRLKNETGVELLSGGMRDLRKQWKNAQDVNELSGASVSYVIGSKAFYIHMVNWGANGFPGYFYLEKGFEATAQQAVVATERSIMKAIAREWKRNMPNGRVS
jgi:hypothetical protein